jgi:hypothetical protein
MEVPPTQLPTKLNASRKYILALRPGATHWGVSTILHIVWW